MPNSRRWRPERPTPLADIAATSGLTLTTRTWLDRTIADVAFDAFSFGHDVLCNEPVADDPRAALERGRRVDGAILAVGSMPWRPMPVSWIAVQSKRGDDLLDLDPIADSSGSDTGSRLIGHERFDETFELDADDDGIDQVRAVLTDEVCDWAVDADMQFGPLVVIFDGAEPESVDAPEHEATVYLARLVDSDTELVDTLEVTLDLVQQLRLAIESAG